MTKFTECGDWQAIVTAFDEIPRTVISRDEGGDTRNVQWIFRGHKDHGYELQPVIERKHGRLDKESSCSMRPNN